MQFFVQMAEVSTQSRIGLSHRRLCNRALVLFLTRPAGDGPTL